MHHVGRICLRGLKVRVIHLVLLHSWFFSDHLPLNKSRFLHNHLLLHYPWLLHYHFSFNWFLHNHLLLYYPWLLHYHLLLHYLLSNNWLLLNNLLWLLWWWVLNIFLLRLILNIILRWVLLRRSIHSLPNAALLLASRWTHSSLIVLNNCHVVSS